MPFGGSLVILIDFCKMVSGKFCMLAEVRIILKSMCVGS